MAGSARRCIRSNTTVGSSNTIMVSMLRVWVFWMWNVVSEIFSQPWQTDTCIGGWFYDRRAVYKTTADIVHMLAEIVSKNGNLLLNIPLRPDGTLDHESIHVMQGI